MSIQQRLLPYSSISELHLITTFYPLSSSQLIAGLKRKNSNSSFSVKSKVKRTESNTSLNSEGCTSRGSSESDLRRGPDGEKKRKLKPDGSKSPTSRLINDSDSEPYLNSYPIQVSNGSSYPQTNVITEGNNSADWFNLPPTAPQSHGQSQRYQQSIPVNNNYNLLPTYSDPTSYNSDPSNYTHGICCNATTANYYQSQSYPHAPHTQTVIQNHNNISQQMDFPDPFGIGGGDFNSVDRGDFTDLIWYDIDDLRENVQEERPYNSNVQVSFSKESISQSHDGSGFQQQTQQSHVQVADAVISRNESSNNISNSNNNNNINNSNNNNRYSAETSSAFGSSEAYTSYEESSLTSCTSSDDGCFDDFDISPSNDQSISDAMAIITNSQKRRLSKSSLALNNMTSYATETEMETETESTPLPLITESEEKSLDTTWLFKEDDEDLVSGIVEAFST